MIRAIALCAALLAVLPAHAQTRPAPRSAPAAAPAPACDPLHLIPGCQVTSGPMKGKTTEDLAGMIAAVSLPDLQYALALSKAANNVVSTPCWQALTDLVSAQQAPLKDAQGNTLSQPDPHLATSIEKISELLAALRPDSPISTGCSALASAAGKDAGTLITGLLSGSALGLFKLPIPIP